MKKLLKKLPDYLLILLGSFIVSVGINLFLVPLKISVGGISGIGTVLLYLFKVPMSITNFTANVLLFIFGMRVLGKSSVFKTIWGIIFLSVCLEITSHIPFTSIDMILGAVFGSVCVGFGVGLNIRRGASTGGTDFIALMIKRRFPQASTATIMLMIDLCIVISLGIVFKDVTITLYSLISIFIASKTVDLMLVRGENAKNVYIVTDKKEEVTSLVLHKMKRGMTELHAKGSFTGEEKGMLMCVCRNREVPELMKLIKNTDPSSFVVISDVKRVVGEGFDNIS